MDFERMCAMPNEKVTIHQATFSIMLFSFGSSVILGISTKANQDVWISILLAAVLAIPVLLIYARIISLFPEKNLYAISEILFGKIIGKIVSVLMMWYSIHLAALVLRNFAEFIQVFDMPETPQLAIMILITVSTTYLARSGMRAIGKWSVVAVCFVCFVVLFTFGTSIHQMNASNLLPLIESSPAQIAKESFAILAFPYAESVIFLCLADSFQKQDSPYKMFFYSLGLIVVVFLLVFMRNLMLLGRAMMELSYYPSYIAVRVIGIGDFFARIESSISSNFILAGIVKISACLLAAGKGIAQVFGVKTHRTLILPMGMCTLALCAILFKSTMEMFAFIDYYLYYAAPFQIIIPLIIWIGAERYTRKQEEKGASTASVDAPLGKEPCS